jgi:hypothetical protein
VTFSKFLNSVLGSGLDFMDTIVAPNSEWTPSLVSVNLKTIWAKRHLDNLEARIRDWVDSHPYSIREEDNPERTLHAFIIETRIAPNDNLGALIVDEDPHVKSWEDGQYSIQNMSIE